MSTQTHPPGAPPPPPQPPKPGPPTGPGRLGLLLLLPLLLLARRPSSWPPADGRRETAAPRPGGMDLSDAAQRYADEAEQARQRRGGFRFGDPVRRRTR